MAKIIRTQRFGEETALYTGTGSLSIHELKDNKFAVVRTLPCGDDPYPHIYRDGIAAQGGQVVDREKLRNELFRVLNIASGLVAEYPDALVRTSNTTIQNLFHRLIEQLDDGYFDSSAVPSAPGWERVQKAWEAFIVTTHRRDKTMLNNENFIALRGAIATLGTPQGSDSRQDGCELIRLERQRQVSKEGYTDEHDDYHTDGEIAWAAACYAVAGSTKKVINIHGNDAFPWDSGHDKRKKHSTVKRLTIAGALIAAEIDRLRRVDASAQAGDEGPIPEPAQPVAAGEAKERGDNE